MATFLKIENGIVTNSIVISNDIINLGSVSFIESDILGRTYINNLYNTDDKWLLTLNSDFNFRKQYAGIGYAYNESKDIFISVKPYESWILDENDDWVPPIDKPDNINLYSWDEETISWILRVKPA